MSSPYPEDFDAYLQDLCTRPHFWHDAPRSWVPPRMACGQCVRGGIGAGIQVGGAVANMAQMRPPSFKGWVSSLNFWRWSGKLEPFGQNTSILSSYRAPSGFPSLTSVTSSTTGGAPYYFTHWHLGVTRTSQTTLELLDVSAAQPTGAHQAIHYLLRDDYIEAMLLNRPTNRQDAP